MSNYKNLCSQDAKPAMNNSTKTRTLDLPTCSRLENNNASTSFGYPWKLTITGLSTVNRLSNASWSNACGWIPPLPRMRRSVTLTTRTLTPWFRRIAAAARTSKVTSTPQPTRTTSGSTPLLEENFSQTEAPAMQCFSAYGVSAVKTRAMRKFTSSIVKKPFVGFFDPITRLISNMLVCLKDIELTILWPKAMINRGNARVCIGR